MFRKVERVHLYLRERVQHRSCCECCGTLSRNFSYDGDPVSLGRSYRQAKSGRQSDDPVARYDNMHAIPCMLIKNQGECSKYSADLPNLRYKRRSMP